MSIPVFRKAINFKDELTNAIFPYDCQKHPLPCFLGVQYDVEMKEQLLLTIYNFHATTQVECLLSIIKEIRDENSPALLLHVKLYTSVSDVIAMLAEYKLRAKIGEGWVVDPVGVYVEKK
jgi:hypothetical protein